MWLKVKRRADLKIQCERESERVSNQTTCDKYEGVETNKCVKEEVEAAAKRAHTHKRRKEKKLIRRVESRIYKSILCVRE